MNNTQKNWNDFWDNYEPSRNDIVYKNMRDKEKNSNFGIKNILITFFVTIGIVGVISIFTILHENLKIEDKQIQTSKSNELINNTYKIDNINGKTMSENVNKINKIIRDVSQNIESYSEEELNKYIIEIQKTDLGNCYNEYKKAAVKKIVLAKSINNSTDINTKNDLIEQYNNIKLFDYLVTAFDEAGVEYWIDKTEIHYKYKE